MATEFGVARLLEDGSFDNNYGIGGRSRGSVEVNGQSEVAAMLIDGSGVIVAGAGSERSLAVMRFLPNGGIDTNFADAGRRTQPLFGGFGPMSDVAFDDAPLPVAGAGGAGTSSATAAPSEAPLAKLEASQPILTDSFQWPRIVSIAQFGESDLGLAAFTRAGERHAPFGDDGLVNNQFLGGSITPRAVTIGGDHRIYVVGDGIPHFSSQRLIIIARYLSNGTLDRGFFGQGGQDGATFVPPGGSNTPTETDGFRCSNVFETRSFSTRFVTVLGSVNVADETRFSVSRFNDTGKLVFNVNTSFMDIANGTAGFFASAGAGDGAGRIIVAGMTGGFPQQIAVARYLKDGSLDETFGQDGKVILSNQEVSTRKINAVVIDGLDRILLVVQDADEMVIHRLLTDGSSDSEFGDMGTVRAHLGEPEESSRSDALAIDHQGRLLVAGTIFLRSGID